MDKKVSVIITDCEDRTFLVRCLNSIKRQTYCNYEMILVGQDFQENISEEYEVIIVTDYSEAFLRCSGEYILFCSMTSVLAPNVLSSLLAIERDEEVCVAANCMIPSGKQYKTCSEAVFSVYGKLFYRQILGVDFIEVLSDAYVLNGEMTLKYLEKYTELDIYDDICIYETDPVALELEVPDINYSDEEIADWLNTIACLPLDYKQKLVQKWVIDDGDICSEEIVRKVLLTASVLVSEKELQYGFVQKYVRQWYQDALEHKSEFLYQSTKEYLGYFEECGEYFEIICKACGITSRQYKHMKLDSLKDYLFFYNKLPDDDEDRKSLKELRLALEIKMREIQLMKVQLEQKFAELKALEKCLLDADILW